MAHHSPKRGHLALKSNALNPTATSYEGQQLILNHMKSHYNRISNVKAAVDTSAPRSMKKHVRVQDQRKRESVKTCESEGKLTPRRRPESISLENLSNYEGNWTRSRPHSSQSYYRATSPCDHSTPEPSLVPGNSSAYQEPANDQIRHQRQGTNEISSRMTPYNSPRNMLQGPLVSHSRWKTVQNRETIKKLSYDYDDDVRDRRKLKLHMNSNPKKEDLQSTDMHNKEDFMYPEYQTQTNVEKEDSFLHRGDSRMSTGMHSHALDSTNGLSSGVSSSHAKRKKEIQTKMWIDEQKYLQFISDVTSDVLARGIFSNRVLNKVFESHIDKRKEDLDERRMRDMIDKLKLDLDITA